jgi:hypothetical protein
MRELAYDNLLAELALSSQFNCGSYFKSLYVHGYTQSAEAAYLSTAAIIEYPKQSLFKHNLYWEKELFENTETCCITNRAWACDEPAIFRAYDITPHKVANLGRFMLDNNTRAAVAWARGWPDDCVRYFGDKKDTYTSLMAGIKAILDNVHLMLYLLEPDLTAVGLTEEEAQTAATAICHGTLPKRVVKSNYAFELAWGAFPSRPDLYKYKPRDLFYHPDTHYSNTEAKAALDRINAERSNG